MDGKPGKIRARDGHNRRKLFLKEDKFIDVHGVSPQSGQIIERLV